MSLRPSACMLENLHLYPKDRHWFVPVDAVWYLVRIASSMRNIDIFRNPRLFRRHLGFWKIRFFYPKDRYWFVPDICFYNLVRIASYLRKLFKFSKIQNGGLRHLGFWKMCIFSTNGSIYFCGCRMYAVEIWRELLYICGNYQHFSKFKMTAATILDFSKFAILTLRIDFG